MNAQFYHSASYVPPNGTKAEQSRQQQQWDDYQLQQRAGRASMSDIADSKNRISTKSRKRADSHQPSSKPSQMRSSNVASPTEQSHAPTMSTQQRFSEDYDERPRRYSSVDPGYVGNRLSPKLSPSYLYDDSSLSGTFNSPTHVELERTIEHRKSLKGVERLRSKVKGWVRV
ncbi:hypothetical protein DE146DRAFT_654008 [Phaeosphaeria sp. MPI-PUGE-AT-0046c]|nr:hypothetical protein DE146DRAFT_654008 [Phaeosphaeria sp. MPI-PUGE-AT-0046c]